MKSEMTTIIKDYKFETIIGMLDFERVAKQEVQMNLEICSTSFIDYVFIMKDSSKALKSLLKKPAKR